MLIKYTNLNKNGEGANGLELKKKSFCSGREALTECIQMGTLTQKGIV